MLSHSPRDRSLFRPPAAAKDSWLLALVVIVVVIVVIVVVVVVVVIAKRWRSNRSVGFGCRVSTSVSLSVSPSCCIHSASRAAPPGPGYQSNRVVGLVFFSVPTTLRPRR